MSIKTILFDLDGTLLPMDQDLFVKYYLGLFAKKLAPLGYEEDSFYKAMWSGVSAMVKNDGSVSNDEAFWNTFKKLFFTVAKNLINFSKRSFYITIFLSSFILTK